MKVTKISNVNIVRNHIPVKQILENIQAFMKKEKEKIINVIPVGKHLVD